MNICEVHFIFRYYLLIKISTVSATIIITIITRFISTFFIVIISIILMITIINSIINHSNTSLIAVVATKYCQIIFRQSIWNQLAIRGKSTHPTITRTVLSKHTILAHPEDRGLSGPKQDTANGGLLFVLPPWPTLLHAPCQISIFLMTFAESVCVC